MKRYELAPAVVPPDVTRFLCLDADEDDPLYQENKPYLSSFYRFYYDYCDPSPRGPIIRNVDGVECNFSSVVSSKMTRSGTDRHAIALRSAQTRDGAEHYRLFVRPFREDTVIEYDVTKAIYSTGDYQTTTHTMIYLAQADDGTQAILEIAGESNHPSVWVIDGEEYLLESIPNLPDPTTTEFV